MIACRRIKASMWLAFIHDYSKLLPYEWVPYAHTFYAPDGTRWYKETPEFDQAWNHHQKCNKHHYQYWVLIYDSGEHKVLPMPKKYIKEMIADWSGCGRAITGRWEIHKWYEKNKDTVILHSDTRKIVEDILATIK
jgi:hypothetical protein